MKFYIFCAFYNFWNNCFFVAKFVISILFICLFIGRTKSFTTNEGQVYRENQ